jgi:hypothetical protein
LPLKPFDVDAEIGAFLESEAMNETQDYLVRGRAFSALKDDQLKADWKNAFERSSASREPSDARITDDLAAELRLRKLEPPVEEISQEIWQKMHAELSRSNAEQGIDPSVLKKIEMFREQRRKAKN